MASDDEVLAPLHAELREAFIVFRSDPNGETWTLLSDMYVGQLTVFDGVQKLDPSFDYPYPMDAADIAEDKLIQWPTIPHPDLVLQAILVLCDDRHSHG
jgi:hypothetical protein